MSLSREQIYVEIKKILDDESMEVGDHICFIDSCFQKSPANTDTFTTLAALCFDCMLEHGAVYRSLEPDSYKKFKKISSFDSVCKVIDGERDYQDRQWCDHTHSVYAYHTMFQHYLTKTIEAWTINGGDCYALDFIRKLAGICVCCLEENS